MFEYIIFYKFKEIPVEDLQSMYNSLEEKYPGAFLMLPDCLSIKKFNIDELYNIKENIEEQIKKIERT